MDEVMSLQEWENWIRQEFPGSPEDTVKDFAETAVMMARETGIRPVKLALFQASLS
jgi:hypothetical protein